MIVNASENNALEVELQATKATLKAQKDDVAYLVSQLEDRGRALSQRYEAITLQTTQLSELPAQIVDLTASIAQLQEQQAPALNPGLGLGLEKTRALVLEREAESRELDRQLEVLRQTVPRKEREVERLRGELGPLEVKRMGSQAAAKEARRRKEEALGGGGDDLEERGRWWRGVEGGLKRMLDV